MGVTVIRRDGRYCSGKMLEDTEPNCLYTTSYHSLLVATCEEEEQNKTASWAQYCSFIPLSACEPLVWLRHSGIMTGSLFGNVQRPHCFMCYITLITPPSRGWRKLDSVLVPGCSHRAASLLGWKAQQEWKKDSRSCGYHRELPRIGRVTYCLTNCTFNREDMQTPHAWLISPTKHFYAL